MAGRVLQVTILGDSASAQRAFEKVGASAMAAAGTADKASTSFERTGAKMSALGGKVESVGKKMTTHLTLPIVAVGGAAVKMGLDFQKAMLLVETHTETSHKQVEKYKKAILEMSASGKYTQGPKELADAMYHIASDGYHGQKALDALRESANLAMLGQSDLAETTYAVVSAMKTGIKGTQNLHETIGILNGTMGAGDTKMGELTAALSTGVVPAAKAAGLELNDVGAALAFLTARGIPAQKAAYGLAMNFQQLVPYTKKAKDETKALGLGMTELGEVASKGPEGWLHALQDLKKHLQGLPKFAQTQAIEELFGGGRTSRGILAQLQNLKDLEATYERLGVIKGRTDKNLKTARESEANELAEEKAKLESAFVKLGTTLMPAVIPAIAKIAETVSGVAEDFAKLPKATQDWIIKAGLAVAALGPMLTIGGNILKVFGGVSKMLGTIGTKLGVIQAEQMAPVTAGGVVPVGGASRAAAAAEASAPGWLGRTTVGATTGRTLQGAYNAETEASYLASMGVTKSVSEAEAVRSALGVGKASGLSLAKGFATSLGKGLLTYGGGGLLVGQVVKEVGHSDLASKVGSAIQGAGVGAAIGTAIAPGIGTGIGAALGGVGALILQSIPDEGGELEAAGAKEARRFFNGFRKEREKGQLQKMVEQGSLGREGRRQGAGEVPGTEYGSTYREGASGLRGQRAELRDKRQSAEYTNQPKSVIKAYSEEISAINRYIAAIKNARTSFGLTVKSMQGDIALGMGAINKDLHTGMDEADNAWGRGTKVWRSRAAEAMDSAVAAIKSGMDSGTINAEKGQKRINELLARIHLVKGDDPTGLAKATSDAFKKAGGITEGGVKKWAAQLEQMPPVARSSTIDSTNKMLQAWAQGHPKIEKSIENLTKFEVSHFGATNKQLREGVKKGATGPVAEAFVEAAQGVGGALGNIGTNTNAMLKALGLHDMVQFQAIVFGPSRMAATTLGAKGAPGEAKHHNRAGGGSVRVPGQGLQDTVGLQVNGVMSAVVAPGEDLMVVNRHQRGPLDFAVANTYGVAGMDGFFSTFDREHFKAQGGQVKVQGPGNIGAVGHGALSKAASAVNAFFRAHQPKSGGAATYSGTPTGPAGTSSYMGVLMATWVRQALEYGAAHGSGNPQPTSGYRSHAQNVSEGRDYFSEHEKTQYPGGAVDFGGMEDPASLPLKMAVVNATRRFKYPLLAPIGFRDDGHASGTGHARGGRVKILHPAWEPRFDKWMNKTWGKARHLYGASGSAPPLFLAQGLFNAFGGDAYEQSGTVEMDPGFAKSAMQGRSAGQETLLHEWTHVFQKSGLKPWETEGGAVAFSEWAGPKVFPGFHPWAGEGYGSYAARVRKEKGAGWIEKGQFRARGGHLPRFAKGGRYTSSDVHTTGTLQPKEAAIAMLLGGFPPNAKVLAEGLGTIAAESNFSLPNNAQGPSGHIGLWAEGTEGFPASASARENPIIASKAAYANWKATGGFEQAWGQWEQEQSGVTGWRNYGAYMKVAEEVLKGVSTTGGGGGHPSKKTVIEHSKHYAPGRTHAGGTSAGFAPHKEIEKARAVGAAHAKNPKVAHNVGTSPLPSWAVGLPLFQREELEGRGTTLPERETILGNAETNAAFEAGGAERVLAKAKAAYAKHPDAEHWAAVVKGSSREQEKRKAQVAATKARKLFEKGYIKHLTVGIKKINHQLATAKGKLSFKQIAALRAKRAELVSLRASARGEAQTATEKLSEYEEAGEAEAAEMEEESPLAHLAQAIGEVDWGSIFSEAAEGSLGSGQAGEERAAVEKEHTEELKSLREEMETTRHFAESATATKSATAWKALSDILSGQLGARSNHLAQTAGNGSPGTL